MQRDVGTELGPEMDELQQDGGPVAMQRPRHGGELGAQVAGLREVMAERMARGMDVDRLQDDEAGSPAARRSW